jgi:amino acid transporter
MSIFFLLFSTVFWAVWKDTQNNNQFINAEWKGYTDDIEVAGSGKAQKDDIIVVVKTAINWVLWLLALIALVILLYGGFQMVTAAGDEKKFDTGMTYLKQAAGWLAMIGVAWFLVSIIFFVIKYVTTS